MNLQSFLSLFIFSFLLGRLATLWSVSRAEKGPRIFHLKIDDQLPRLDIKILKITSLGTKVTGLLNHISLCKNEGLLIKNTSKIHCNGMLFPIAVIFISRQGTVTKIHTNVEPGQVCRGPRGTAHTLEINIEAELLNNITENSHLEFIPV